MTWVLLLVSYLLGAIPSSYIGARAAHGIDLRQHGSGNLGATNAFRVLGWKTALPVLLFDILKGWFPTFAFPLWDGAAPAAAAGGGWAFAYGCAEILGHDTCWSISLEGVKSVQA